ncbi:Multidrug export protein EmrA [Planctomycetes bacterium Pan216]|uniref:Multidrug export protein EmrA n=1 Tax=Kolteria novifilia TaxID=2527975 RepID=A0A518B3G6_9BACT|nr:Multidrug export protein EmrA [Planctomycetes bacterium Pan216]
MTEQVPVTSEMATPRRRKVFTIGAALIVLLLLLAAGTTFLWSRWTHSISNDAFVDAYLINVSPQVAGDIVEVYVREQQRVEAGQLLALIDPTPYQREVALLEAARDVATAALEKSKSELAFLEEDVPLAIAISERRLQIARDRLAEMESALLMVTRDVENGVRAASFQVEAAKAAVVLSEEDYVRYGALYEDRSATERRFEVATKSFEQARAQLEASRARLGQAEAQRQRVPITEHQRDAARGAVEEAERQVEVARLRRIEVDVKRRAVVEHRRKVTEAERAIELAATEVEYTRIVAPYDGIIARKWRHLGDYAQRGEPLFSMYDPDFVFVTCHLGEDKLDGVAPGNRVSIQLEAYGEPFEGRVLWLGSATGANFSLLPRDLSSGEFTYVIQRVPTRILVDRDERWPLLIPGLSATVRIDHGPGDPQWVEEGLRWEDRAAHLSERARD